MGLLADRLRLTTTSTVDFPATFNDDTNDAQPFHTDHGSATRWAADLGHKPAEKAPRYVRNLLDTPSDPNPLLDALMHNALLGIYLRSDGGTARFDQAGKGRGRPEGHSMAPTSGLAQDVEELERAYRSSRTHRRRLMVIKEAQRLAVACLKMDPAKVRGTDEWKAAICRDTRSVRVVAKEFGVGKSTIARIKADGVPRVAKATTLSHTSQAAFAASGGSAT